MGLSRHVGVRTGEDIPVQHASSFRIGLNNHVGTRIDVDLLGVVIPCQLINTGDADRHIYVVIAPEEFSAPYTKRETPAITILADVFCSRGAIFAILFYKNDIIGTPQDLALYSTSILSTLAMCSVRIFAAFS